MDKDDRRRGSNLQLSEFFSFGLETTSTAAAAAAAAAAAVSPIDDATRDDRQLAAELNGWSKDALIAEVIKLRRELAMLSIDTAAATQMIKRTNTPYRAAAAVTTVAGTGSNTGTGAAMNDDAVPHILSHTRNAFSLLSSSHRLQQLTFSSIQSHIGVELTDNDGSSPNLLMAPHIPQTKKSTVGLEPLKNKIHSAANRAAAASGTLKSSAQKYTPGGRLTRAAAKPPKKKVRGRPRAGSTMNGAAGDSDDDADGGANGVDGDDAADDADDELVVRGLVRRQQEIKLKESVGSDAKSSASIAVASFSSSASASMAVKSQLGGTRKKAVVKSSALSASASAATAASSTAATAVARGSKAKSADDEGGGAGGGGDDEEDVKEKLPRGWPKPNNTVDEKTGRPKPDVYFSNLLIWEKVPRELQWLRSRIAAQQPMEGVRIRRITAPDHPCFGELGVFAVDAFDTHEHIMNYAGVIKIRHKVNGKPTTQSSSRYIIALQDQPDTDRQDDGMDAEFLIEIDAARVGNESRFINDIRNTGQEANVYFRRYYEQYTGELHIGIHAKRPINKDEELLIEYGEEFWNIFQESDGEGGSSEVSDDDFVPGQSGRGRKRKTGKKF